MATKKFLDYAGVQHLIGKLKTRQFAGMGLSAEDFTSELKGQLVALYAKLEDFDPDSVAADSTLATLQQKVDGLAAIINSAGTDDGDTVINKLNEVFAFLADLSSDQKLKAIVDGKADKATTLAGYGITDAKIENGTITLGAKTITPLTEHQSLAAYAKTADVNAAIGECAKKTEMDLTINDINAELANKMNAADILAITSDEIDSIIDPNAPQPAPDAPAV